MKILATLFLAALSCSASIVTVGWEDGNDGDQNDFVFTSTGIDYQALGIWHRPASNGETPFPYSEAHYFADAYTDGSATVTFAFSQTAATDRLFVSVGGSAYQQLSSNLSFAAGVGESVRFMLNVNGVQDYFPDAKLNSDGMPRAVFAFSTPEPSYSFLLAGMLVWLGWWKRRAI